MRSAKMIDLQYIDTFLMYYLFKICVLSDLHIKIEVAKKKCCISYEVSMHGVVKKKMFVLGTKMDSFQYRLHNSLSSLDMNAF